MVHVVLVFVAWKYEKKEERDGGLNSDAIFALLYVKKFHD